MVSHLMMPARPSKTRINAMIVHARTYDIDHSNCFTKYAVTAVVCEELEICSTILMRYLEPVPMRSYNM